MRSDERLGRVGARRPPGPVMEARGLSRAEQPLAYYPAAALQSRSRPPLSGPDLPSRPLGQPGHRSVAVRL